MCPIKLRSTGLLVAASFFVARASSSQVVITADRHVGSTDQTIDGQDVVVQGATLTMDGRHRLRSLRLTQSATLTHTSGIQYQGEDGLVLDVDFDLIVESGSQVDVTGRGLPRGGPGWQSGLGASHGGLSTSGGTGVEQGATGPVFGSFVRPRSFGSGNFRSVGGGAVALSCGGLAEFEGSLRADGLNGSSGHGAAGGSIFVEADTLRWTGRISAHGTDAANGITTAGGGGRIALVARKSLEGDTIVQALGGRGSSATSAAAAGTVFLREGTQRGTLIIDNGGRSSPAYTPLTMWSKLDANLVLRGSAFVRNRVGLALLVDVAGDLTIEAGSRIDASGRGSAMGVGQSLRCRWSYNGSYYYGGAGHGGEGGTGGGSGVSCGAPRGRTYDWDLFPILPGSGVVQLGLRGGASIVVNCGGTATVNGAIQCGGGPTSAGGSILMFAERALGTSTLYARGGSNQGYRDGSGAGGRIAVYANEIASTLKYDVRAGVATNSVRTGRGGTFITGLPPKRAGSRFGQSWPVMGGPSIELRDLPTNSTGPLGRLGLVSLRETTGIYNWLVVGFQKLPGPVFYVNPDILYFAATPFSRKPGDEWSGSFGIAGTRDVVLEVGDLPTGARLYLQWLSIDESSGIALTHGMEWKL